MDRSFQIGIQLRGVLVKKLQERNTVDNLLHQCIATFNRESLPSEKALRQTTEDIERRFSDKMRQQYEEYREIAKSVNIVSR